MATRKKKTGKKAKTKKKVARKIVRKKTTRRLTGKTTKKTTRKIAKKKSRRSPALRKAKAIKGLTPSALTHAMNPGKFNFKNTSELSALNDIVGQDRALRALRLGVELGASGYNIYVSGMSGTGKMSTVKRLLDQIRPNCPALRDFLYVYNYHTPNEPILITLPASMGAVFTTKMGRLLNLISHELPHTLQGEGILDQKEALAKQFLDQQKEMFTGLEMELKTAGLVLTQVKMGSVVRPEIMIPVGENAYPIEQLSMLIEMGELEPEEDLDLKELEKTCGAFRQKLRAVMKESRRLNETMVERLEALDREIVTFLIGGAIEDLQDDYEQYPKIIQYLNDYREYVLDHIGEIRAAFEDGDEHDPRAAHGADMADPYLPFRVNLVMDNGGTKQCPIVLETNPTFNNVFGTIERRMNRAGNTFTDFTRITAGALLRADGGYLVLNAQDALSEPGVWRTLKRILVHKELVIQGIEGLLQVSTASLKPEPILIEVTLILIGTPQLYFLLDHHDEEFRKVFKVRADFDHEMPVDKKSVEYYSRFVAQMTEREETLPFSAAAVGRLMAYGIRLAGRKSRITTRFGEIADIVRESSFWAVKRDRKVVDSEEVEHTILDRRERLNLIEGKVRSRIRDGVVLIDTEGERIGQVNGLAVLTYGQHRFGMPSRITVSMARGKGGIINIERESHLSGSTHDKGVLILSGFLREQFTQNIALSLTASICFEQSYGGVDGDSASSTELYALLSAIAEVPIRQDLAVTGSVNQKGDIQAIGGANEKIEGFFMHCKERGLTGKQGVLIPESNVQDLMLSQEVRDAVKKGRFHIYGVKRIEEGIELLTGIRAGKKSSTGAWERGSLFSRVQERLKKLDATPPARGARKKAARKKRRSRRK